MAHFPDLGTETQIASASFVRAIGWLSNTAPFSTGDGSPAFVSKLRELAKHCGESTQALGWPVAGGPHTCELCGMFRAAGNFGVPGESLLYVAPEMVAHYVDVHRYAPPTGFVDAVMRCPVPGTPEYAQAVSPFVAAPTS